MSYMCATPRATHFKRNVWIPVIDQISTETGAAIDRRIELSARNGSSLEEDFNGIAHMATGRVSSVDPSVETTDEAYLTPLADFLLIAVVTSLFALAAAGVMIL